MSNHKFALCRECFDKEMCWVSMYLISIGSYRLNTSFLYVNLLST